MDKRVEESRSVWRRASRVVWLASLLTGLMVQGSPSCAEEGVIRFQPIEDTRQTPIPARFRLGAHDFQVQMQTRTTIWGSDLQAWDVTFPSPVVTEHVCNNEVSCEYYAPVGGAGAGDGERRPGVVVLHILGGDFELSRLCCRTLAFQGIGALFVKMPYYGPRRPEGQRVRMVSEDPEQTVAGMTQAVLDIRRAGAWLAARPEIDPQRIGITGISLGGMVSALAASAEPRFQNVCLVLAGGDFYRIIAESDETADLRRHWAERTFDEAYIRDQLAQIDPLTYAHQLRERRVIMFNARRDEVVPPECTERLWKAAGQPEIHWWDAGHYTAIWHLPRALEKMCKFFNASEVKVNSEDGQGRE